MWKNFVSLLVVLSVFGCNRALPLDNETTSSSKSDSESSAKSTIDSKKNDRKFAAPLSELENARTHNSWRPSFLGNSRVLPFQLNLPTHLPLQKPFLKPIQPAPIVPVAPPVVQPIVQQIPHYPPPPMIHQPVYSPPIISKPILPIVNKPTLVVSQQVVHKPFVTEKIEIIRRPVISEIVEVVHKPILSEVQQVIKHPTYVEHVVKKPFVNTIKNEFQGTPLRLPSQHYELQDKPQFIQPVTAEVLQIPHQQVPVHKPLIHGIGSGYKPFEAGYSPSHLGGITSSIGQDYGYGSSYGLGTGYGSSYGLGTGYLGSSYGLGSGYGSSYGLGSGYGSGYGSLLGSGYGSSYGLGSGYGSGYGSLGSGYGSSYGLGSTYGSSYGFGPGYGSSYGLTPGYGQNYGVSPVFGGEYGGVEHTYVEPAIGCRGDNCRPSTSEVSSEGNTLYNLPARPEYRDRDNIDEREQGMQPEFYYFDPQQMPTMPSEEQMPEPQQASMIADFLSNPSVRESLQNLYRGFLESNTRKPTAETNKPMMARDNDGTVNDTGMDKSEPKDFREEKVKIVMDSIENMDGAGLQKIEKQIKQRQNDIEKLAGKVSDNISTTMKTS